LRGQLGDPSREAPGVGRGLGCASTGLLRAPAQHPGGPRVADLGSHQVEQGAGLPLDTGDAS